MSLQQTLEEIKKVKPFAEEDVTTGPAETLNARRGRRNQSIEKLKILKRAYTRDMLATAVFIVATGAGRESFAALAQEKFGCFSADPEEFYKDLAGRVPPVLYLNKDTVSNIFDVLGRHLEDKMGELDINEYNQLLFKAEFAGKITSADEFTDLVKRAVNKQIGAEIAGLQAIRSLAEVAIEKEHSDRITPIVLTTNDEQLALDLTRDLARLNPRVYLTVTGKSSKVIKSTEGAIVMKEANEETVTETMTSIRSSLKK